MGIDPVSFVAGRKTGGEQILSPTLPLAYQQVEYLETTDYQYVVIPYQLQAGDILVAKISVANGTGDQAFAGWYPNGWELYFSSNYQVKAWYSSNGPINGTAPITNAAGQGVNYVLISFTQVGNQDMSIRVGVYRPDNYAFAGKIYRFAVLSSGNGENNTFNLLPCYRIADNEPGFYDIIGGKFYTNQGTGAFTAGPDV